MAIRKQQAVSRPGAAFDRYLDLLGVPRRPPGWDALAELNSAHLRRIPFENVSKIHRARVQGIRTTPSLEEFLDGIELFHFGGTCYVNNHCLHLLLMHLGYTVRLCAADIAVEGAPPNGHMVNVVTIDGREAVVDVGYGAPFWRPIPVDSADDIVFQLGSERYVMKPKDGNGRSKLELYRESELKHGYLLKPEARGIEDFAEVIARSYRDTAPFLNALSLARFYEDRALVLRNHVLTAMEGSESRVRILESRDDIRDAIVNHFEMPAAVVDRVMDALPELKVWNS